MTNFPSILPPSPDNSIAESFTRPIETILRFNVDVISSFQSATVGWVRRRQEAVTDSVASFEKLLRSQDISEAMTIQREWAQRSMRRLDEDLTPVAIQTSEMLKEEVSGGERAVATMSEAAQVPAGVVENDVSAMQPPHKKARSTKKESHPKQAKSRSRKRRR